jgi:hypothetical protein
MYKIKYSYRTGDSFHTEELENILEYEWEDLDIAKDSLKRIKEHYKWYEGIESHSRFSEKIPKPDWHNVNSEHVSSEHYLLNIKMDNGKEVQFWPPWCGYFEALYGAEIISEGDNDMKFEVGY